MTAAASATSVRRLGHQSRTVLAPPLLLVPAALVPVVAYVVVAVLRIGYPYELTYFEGSTVEVAARVVAGQPLYAPPTTEYAPWPYPPLYFWLSGALARVTGLNLFTLRLVSFVASVVVLALLVLIVRRATGNLVAGIVAAGLYAATYRVSGAWADTARVDSLLLALLLAAVLVGMRARTWRGGAALGVVFFVAFLAKQNALVVAAPVLLWLLFRRRPVGVGATATLGGAIAVSTLVGQRLTDGWYARYVIFQLPSQSWTLRWLWDFWLQDLLYPFALSVVVLVSVLLAAHRRGRPHRRVLGDQEAYLLAGLAGLLLASWAARLHEGGYSNVVMPAYAGLAALLGVLLARLLRSMASASRSDPWSIWSRTALLAALLIVQAGFMSSWHSSVIPTRADQVAGDRLIADLRQLPGRVLVPTHPYYLRLAGLPGHASSIAIYDILHARGGREAVGTQLPWSLDGVSAVVLDNETDMQLFGPELAGDFTLITPALVPESVFVPVTDTPTHPALLFVRTSETSNR